MQFFSFFQSTALYSRYILLLLLSSSSINANALIISNQTESNNIVIQDDNNQTFQRVISLAPHITEMLFSAGAGDRVVGVVDYSDYPNKALIIERVGGYHGINIEKILQLKPDLIIAWKTGNRLQDIERLQALNFKVIFSEPQTLHDIPNEIRQLGKKLGTQKQAEQTAQELDRVLNSLRQTYANKKPLKTYYQIWNKPLMTINGQQFISQALKICGAQNIFDALPTLTPEVDIESIIHQNPNIIFLGGQKSMQKGWLKEWQSWDLIQAVKDKHIYALDIDIYQRPTERFIHGLKPLCEKIDSVRKSNSSKLGKN